MQLAQSSVRCRQKERHEPERNGQPRTYVPGDMKKIMPTLHLACNVCFPDHPST